MTSRETAPTLDQNSNGTMRADGWDRFPIIRMTNINLEPGEWKLDEGTGIIADDTSQYTNTGILTNMEEADWVNGISGDALLFDGFNEFVNCSDDPSLNMTEFTIEAWINLAGLNK